MDAISDTRYYKIVIMKSARVGATSWMENTLGYHIDYDPCPILVVQPTVEDAQDWSKDNLATMLRDTPCLEGKVKEARAKDSDNTILHKKFPGGYIKIVGANSPRGFRRVTVRVLLFDELDGAPPSAGSEGAPLFLAERRTGTVWNRKIVVASTPTTAGVSPIEHEYSFSDQRHYYVPCPKCQHMQVLVFSQKSQFAQPTRRVSENSTLIGEISRGSLRFDPENVSWACYICENCSTELGEADKYRMVRAGEWRPLNPSNAGIAGFHISEMYSTFNTTWMKLAQDFMKAKQQRETLRAFINTRLGETFEEQDAFTVADSVLADRVEEYEELPQGVLLLTAGVDVQGDRLECAVWGWGESDVSWLVDYQVFYGGPHDKFAWANLDAYTQKSFKHASKISLPITCIFVDSGSYTLDVYKWTGPRQTRGIFSIKGRAGRRVLIDKPSRDKRTRALIFTLGVDDAKMKLYDRLRDTLKTTQEAPCPGYMHFNKKATPEFFRQLTAERLIRKWNKGYPVWMWELPANRRNEALDTAVYALCAKEFLNPNFEKLKENLQTKAERMKDPKPDDGAPPTAAPQKKTRARSSFVQGGIGGWQIKL